MLLDHDDGAVAVSVGSAQLVAPASNSSFVLALVPTLQAGYLGRYLQAGIVLSRHNRSST